MEQWNQNASHADLISLKANRISNLHCLHLETHSPIFRWLNFVIEYCLEFLAVLPSKINILTTTLSPIRQPFPLFPFFVAAVEQTLRLFVSSCHTIYQYPHWKHVQWSMVGL